MLSRARPLSWAILRSPGCGYRPNPTEFLFRRCRFAREILSYGHLRNNNVGLLINALPTLGYSTRSSSTAPVRTLKGYSPENSQTCPVLAAVTGPLWGPRSGAPWPRLKSFQHVRPSEDTSAGLKAGCPRAPGTYQRWVVRFHTILCSCSVSL